MCGFYQQYLFSIYLCSKFFVFRATFKNNNSVALVRQRTIPTERPTLDDESENDVNNGVLGAANGKHQNQNNACTNVCKIKYLRI
jgi:hypothetical protein